MLHPLDARAPYGVGPFRLLAGLGSGGMGTVHLAISEGGDADALVALKTVRQDLELDPDFRLRFRREADAARAVRSPYVSALVAADPDAERPWLATQYVAGPSLSEAVARTGRLPVPVVRELGADLARGLAAIHGARLVHRDLKPANVVLGTAGPRVIDFGIAQAYDATQLTATGIMVGSPGFMSPEHVAGDRSVGSASDVFCLGAVLCFAATGHGPFDDAEFAAVVHRIATGQPDLSRLPDDLAEVVTACLRPEPGRRPTIDALIRMLDPAAAAARPGSAPTHRTGPFPWPDGIRAVIGEYETAVRQTLARPLPPRRAPTPPVAPAPDATATPTPARTRPKRLGWALGAGAALLASGLIAVLLSLPGDTGNDKADSGSSPGPQRPTTGAPAAAAPVVTSETSDFGPEGLDRTKLPEGWSPWTANFDNGGSPRGCALSGTTLVCKFWDEASSEHWVEARDATNGKHKWRYPDTGTVLMGNRLGFDLDARHLYVRAHDSAGGFAVVRLADGEVTGLLPGSPGYRPSTVRLHKGQAFVSYEGQTGDSGGSGNMLFRAYSTADRQQQWERVLNLAWPDSLDIVGAGLVHVSGALETLTLDPATGRTIKSVQSSCQNMARGGRYLTCPDGPRDSATLEKAEVFQDGVPTALSRDGSTALQGNISGAPERSTELVAYDIKAGGRKWSVPWDGKTPVMVAGKHVMTGVGAMHKYSLADGKETGSNRGYEGWPVSAEGGTASPAAGLALGGALFLVFENGTVVSAYAP